MKADTISKRLKLPFCIWLAAGLSLFCRAQEGVYLSMQHPEWPPLPDNVLNLSVYWLSNNVNDVPVYSLEDLSIDYDELAAQLAQSLSGSDDEESLESSGGGIFRALQLWIERSVAGDYTGGQHQS